MARPEVVTGTAAADEVISRGHALEDRGDLAGALALYRQAAAAAPQHARAHLNVGNALLATGDGEGAAAAYQRALELNPGYAPAHFNLGNVHARHGRQREALACYRAAVEHDARFTDAWIALGNTFDELGDATSALAHYEEALAQAPGFAPLWVNVATVQRRLGLHADAERSVRRALSLAPDSSAAHAMLGKLLLDAGDADGALAAFRDAARDPGNAAALAQASHCANQVCDWSRRAADERALEQLVAHGAPGLPPFYLLTLHGKEAAALQRRAALQFAQSTLGPLLGAPAMRPSPRPRRDRLRIGYLSADFHEHATMHLLRGVLQSHDASRFHIAAYSYGSTDDAMTQAAREACDEFVDIASLPDAEAAQRIADGAVDILVDLKGFTREARPGICALRPAPVIVNWLGYPGTLGTPRLADWVIGDATVTPLECAADFSESLALMPHCYQPNDRARPIADRPTRRDAGLPEEAFVFCSFNQGYKFSPESFDVWCRLLRAVPGSVLWLLPGSQAMARNLRREAAARGVSPEQLVFAPTLPQAQHLARTALADLALDTFPYTSHTTGSDALWAGVPLVTRTGHTFASRVAASLLRACGLPELIASDWTGYEAIAWSLAMDRSRLAEVRAQLESARATAPLFDTQRFTRDLERLYLCIRDRHEAGSREPVVLAPSPSAP